jgi:FkbM family methyltransferase
LKDFLTTKKLVIKYCGDNPTVIVAGAHVGYNELILSEIKGSLMFSFEPFPSTYEYLKMNIRDNGIQNVSIFNMGLSSKKENLRMGTAHKSGANSVLLGNASESYECKFDTVDNIMVEKEIKKLDLLKIDVEGHDIEVLKGAVNTIRKFKPAIQVEITKSDNAYFPNYDLDWLLKLLSEFSCEIFEIYKGKVIPVPDLNEFFKRNRIQNDLFIVIE